MKIEKIEIKNLYGYIDKDIDFNLSVRCLAWPYNKYLLWQHMASTH